MSVFFHQQPGKLHHTTMVLKPSEVASPTSFVSTTVCQLLCSVDAQHLLVVMRQAAASEQLQQPEALMESVSCMCQLVWCVHGIV
jgi:hypothetical protein